MTKDQQTEDVLSDTLYANFLNEVAKVASKELREDKNVRQQCLQQFKEWINKNADIENCVTDNNFLLRFLRAKKFSIPMAEQTLLKYLNLRKRYKQLFYNMDCLDPKLDELINSGYIVVSPYRDDHGRRVIITTPSKFDPYKFNSVDMARIHIFTYETLLEDETNQILGCTHIADVGGVTAAHITMWPINDFATLMKWGEQSYPMRHKKIHLLNMPKALKYVYEFAQSRVSPKLRDRVVLHNTVQELHKDVDIRLLPREYGGTMSLNEMVQFWKNEMASKRDRLLSFDKMDLLSDRGIVRRKSKPESDDSISLQGSFRRLEVD